VAVQILTDADIARSCTASRAVRVMRQAIAAHAEGRLAAPPRAYTQLEAGPMVYTAGGLSRRVHGVRIYDYAGSEQAVAVWNSETGRLAALAVGDELGRRRTGAIGAVAIDALARPDANTLGIVGTGDQAWSQVWAATAVRHWRRVAVYGRRFSAREAFAARCRDELLVDAVAVESAERAVRGRDVVIIATNSSTPVIDMSWITPGTHVTTLGPKTVTAHEMPLDLADQADVLVTDSLTQVRAYPEPYALPTDRMVELSAILAGTAPGRRTRDQITVFCSVGLAGTEVVLAADLAAIGFEPEQPKVPAGRTQRHRATPVDEVVEELGPEAVVVADLPGEPAVPAEPAAEAQANGAPPAEVAAEADGSVRPEIAVELRAAVAELAAIPPPRVPTPDAEDGAAPPEPAKEAGKAQDTGPGARLPTRPVPGVRSAKDILAAAAADEAAGTAAEAESESDDDGSGDSLKTLDEIFAFSDLTGDKPPTIQATGGDGKPDETAAADAEPAGAAPKGARASKPSGDAKPANDADAKPAEAEAAAAAAEQPADGKGAAASGSAKDAAGDTPASVAKVVSRRDAPARVGGQQGRGGQPNRGGNQRGGGPHRDRPTGGNES